MIHRGEVWVGNLNPSRGKEVGKIRPVLVIQADALTQAGAETVIVLPLTTQVRPGWRRFRIPLPARDRLLMASYVVIDKPRALDPARLVDGPLTRLTDEEMTAVEQSLGAVLGM
ncbi:MAG: type II toxin-antitoxin system PemK/MazF family toxin [Halomonas sp.]|uniref:type II toxin-antitoxin system PemK/MazF family toxin n=1 Tax=Halomonas sp. TaxID=1486246 RepID=UPI002ACD692C|nr:type II toxin-antitoxin system PemK/MazF family toxin [Halomonas sp.]MDZ7851078.1 type II toxin-antitoxin system PemK/MazF family toxin [Halomonas sp.]